jgi:hypothetical protein
MEVFARRLSFHKIAVAAGFSEANVTVRVHRTSTTIWTPAKTGTTSVINTGFQASGIPR